MNAIAEARRKTFMPTLFVPGLKSTQVMDPGSGNATTLKRAVDLVAKFGGRAFCLGPIHETEEGMASQFSRTSNNALSRRLIDLLEVPEIKNNRKLRQRVESDMKNIPDGPKTDLKTTERLLKIHLKAAYQWFVCSSDNGERKAAFIDFCEQQAWWLDKYAYFKVLRDHYGMTDMKNWDQEFADMGSRKAQTFMREHKSQMDYYKFVQLEAYRQVAEVLSYAREEKGITEIELLAPVGIARTSAEGFLMQDLYDPEYQIGCFPEPENGYPIQLWGFLAERGNEALLEFKIRSFQNLQALGVTTVSLDHACGALGGYTTFPVYGENGRRLDPRKPADAAYAEMRGRWMFDPRESGAEERRQAYADRMIEAIMSRLPGLRLSAETVGDFARRVAAEQAISRAISRGGQLTLMRGLPYEHNNFTDAVVPEPALEQKFRERAALVKAALISEGFLAINRHGELAIQRKLYETDRERFCLASLSGQADQENLQKQIWLVLQEYRAYVETDRLSFTHDMFQFLTHLTGYLGETRLDWMQANGASHVRHFLNRLGILTAGLNQPLEPAQITQDFMLEVFQRFVSGSEAGTVAMLFSSLYHLLPEYADSSTRFCVNVQPGTPGEINNPRGNWEQRLPAMEELAAVMPQLTVLAERVSRHFGSVRDLASADRCFQAQVKAVEAESVVYQAQNGGWTVWPAPAGVTPLMEMAAAYTGSEVAGGHEGKAWATYEAQTLGVDFKRSGTYIFHELVSGKSYVRTGEQLLSEGFKIGLNQSVSRQHFVVYQAAA